ncbi:hypothetical protein [Flavobacterium sp. fv08]|uniref:hypothetical protein n=1 Tax=Flavobacterium sp. fv08 TaxID=1761784 RepID=UPI0008C44160|nr:hypothetical protein [Flavobacterium sp. fv08]SEP06240.1 hypothetical protein SAMN04487978_4354 [Flavobacterium sp. fv08]
MMTNNEVAQVFDTVLSSPGMNEQVRIDTRISRKAILLLHQIIDGGFSGKEQEGTAFSSLVSAETQEELKVLGTECLNKAGLVEMSEKLLRLSSLGKK